MRLDPVEVVLKEDVFLGVLKSMMVWPTSGLIFHCQNSSLVRLSQATIGVGISWLLVNSLSQ